MLYGFYLPTLQKNGHTLYFANLMSKKFTKLLAKFVLRLYNIVIRKLHNYKGGETMEYISVKQAAEKWNMSERFVQRRCTEGRVEGATKLGNAWMIPVNAKKPEDRRKLSEALVHEHKHTSLSDAEAIKHRHDIMPLMNAAFPLGKCKEYIESIKDADEKNIAFAEYCYYTGNAKRCLEIVEKYLANEIFELRASAVWLYGLASIYLNKTELTKKAYRLVKEIYDSTDDNSPKQERALAVCLYNTVLTRLNFPRPKELPQTQQYVHILPPGLRLYVLYTQAHFAYNNQLPGVSIGIAETSLTIDDVGYPIASIYLHLACAMCYIHLGYKHLSESHLLEALEFAKPDEIIMPFGELHKELCGMVEAVMKKKLPEEFRKIILIAKNYSVGW